MTPLTPTPSRGCHRHAARASTRSWTLFLLAVGLLLALLLPAGSAAAAESAGQVTWASAPADTSIGKGRSHYAYTLAPGTSLTDAMAVVNRSSTPITLNVYASDAFTTSNGNLDLLPANRKPTDVGAWTTVRTRQLTLAPQQSAIIPFTVTVPANATPGDHTGGVVTSLVTEGSGTVSLDRRLGSRLYLRVTGDLKPGLGVSDVKASFDGSANPASGGSSTVTYTVTNTGNVRLAAHQGVTVSGPFGAVTTSAVLADLPELLPGDTVRRSATVQGVWPTTQLEAAVTLQPFASGDQPPLTVAAASASASTWAWPWSQLLLVVVLVLLVLGYLRLRRSRAEKVQAAIAAAVEKARTDAGENKEPNAIDLTDQDAIREAVDADAVKLPG